MTNDEFLNETQSTLLGGMLASLITDIKDTIQAW